MLKTDIRNRTAKALAIRQLNRSKLDTQWCDLPGSTELGIGYGLRLR